ncbi:hypothetical protein RRG08_061848 [Elysia crispata]|uniref:Uncharacterized protein n=1 Tax=Elysia crispata TaxID=231223 RepID=A0AAE0YLV7_9GAST|nr:hypothetical protein RRG08_061848 [Elysia crispata]
MWNERLRTEGKEDEERGGGGDKTFKLTRRLKNVQEEPIRTGQLKAQPPVSGGTDPNRTVKDSTSSNRRNRSEQDSQRLNLQYQEEPIRTGQLKAEPPVSGGTDPNRTVKG